VDRTTNCCLLVSDDPGPAPGASFAQTTRPGVQLPIPLPGSKKVKGAVQAARTMDEISESQFGARLGRTTCDLPRGFLYFDVGDISTPLAGAKLFT